MKYFNLLVHWVQPHILKEENIFLQIVRDIAICLGSRKVSGRLLAVHDCWDRKFHLPLKMVYPCQWAINIYLGREKVWTVRKQRENVREREFIVGSRADVNKVPS